MNSTYALKKGRTLIYDCFSLESEVGNLGEIVLVRWKVRKYTKRLIVYQEIFRKCTELFSVAILRNKNSLDEGLYFVGRRAYVGSCIKLLYYIITRTEEFIKDYLIYPPRLTRLDFIKHGNKIRSDFAYKQAKKALRVVFDLCDYKDSIIPMRKVAILTQDETLINRFIKESPVLFNKTRYYGKIRYVD